jgi:septation ring formation regulator EzrA
VIDQLGKVLKDLPNLCITISTVIPDKLTSLENRYDEMTQASYPLHHLILKSDLDDMANQLSAIAQRVKSFNLKGVSDDLDQMQHRIDSYFDGFDKEKSARVVFEKECDGIYKEDNSLEDQFIQLCHALPGIRKVYAIGPEEQGKLDSIQNMINKAGATKRSLDTYVHSATKQPYSILVEKMHALRDQAEEASGAISDFQHFLLSLKTDSENANSSLSIYWQRLKRSEKIVRDINLDAVTKRFMPSIDALYATLDSLYADLSTLPIDVKKVDADLTVLRSSGDQLVHDVEKTQEDLTMAENAMVFANRHRISSGDINSLLIQTEGLFYSGNFTASYEQATDAVKHLKESD